MLRTFAQLSCLLLLIHSSVLQAQVTCDPVFPTQNDNVTIYYDATQGNGALTGVSPVYAHMGVITTESNGPNDWKFVATTWAVANTASTMQADGTNKWKKSINIQQFFNLPANTTVLKLAFVFRNATGNIVGRATDGSDIFYDVSPANAPLQASLQAPTVPIQLAFAGQVLPVKGVASAPSTLKLFDNGNLISNMSNATLLQTIINVSGTGLHVVEFVAEKAAESDTARFSYIIPENLPAQDQPAGTENGINYLTDQSVRLALYAPGKLAVHAIGDFNNWLPTSAWQMRKSMDGNTWWIDVPNLPAGQPVRFQYLVDGALKVADPLSTLILDPGSDPYIPPLTFPNIPAYPTSKTTGAVSVLKTAQTPYNWTAANYQRPTKSSLVVYELLMRDFLTRHDYQTLLDTLDHLEKLGVNAIELMPINEFDDNLSWGYNPSYHKALDKYYGTPEALKALIDECHHRGIAVIVDVVFNQASGSSPLAKMYWDTQNNRPAANNPWLNPIATHEFSVFNDFNHESQATKSYVKNCLKYWMTEYKIDGFRFDLSKGFTQKNTLGSVGAWGVYDPTRVAIWKDYANFMWSIDPNFYVILEHFADNVEEKELAEYGMMLWGNMFGAYKDVALGFPSALTSNLSGISHQQRGWNVPHLIGYMESHDEERISYELKTYGNNADPNYNVRSTLISMRRYEMLNNLLYTVPGPKMLWQFGELGYDYSINTCEDGSINNGCRLSPKPIRWDFKNDPYRRRLYNITSALLQLRQTQPVFQTTDFQLNISGGAARTIRLNSPGFNVHVLANVATTSENVTPDFQHTGTWYEYYTGETLNVSNTATPINLAAGEYRLYTDQFVPLPAGVTIGTNEAASLLENLEIYPNPTNEAFFVDFSVRQSSDVHMVVTDMSGRQVISQLHKSIPVGLNQVRLNVTGWQQGIYFISLTDNAGGRISRKLAVMD
ncbi:MAG: T9SS type A sorting domain-containing protein [Saprospiraceae bacterium]|nr:T9SS type A sorting domain-containing protein [Saprospiraceae bacterium]